MNENNLYNYQKTCVDHIINHLYCGLFLDMGLGKSVITLTAINYLLYDYCEINSALVIAPKRVIESVWKEEADKWEHLQNLKFSKIIGNEKNRIKAIEKSADIYLISRDNIKWLCEYFNFKLPYEMVIIDELSSFKSFKSQRFKSLRKSRPFIKRLVGLTGTPAPNGYIDLWPQIFLMDMGNRLEKTISMYRDKYFNPAKRKGFIVYSYKLKKNAAKQIEEKIRDICISMTSKDYLELPSVINNYIKLPMSLSLKTQYEKFEKERVMEIVKDPENIIINSINAAALTNKLLQFANGSIYDEEHNVFPIHDIKLEALKDIIDNANGQSVLIAWVYRFDRDRIKEYLKMYAPRDLNSAEDIRDWNNGNIQVLLAHPASAGHGLNLQLGGHIIVWYGLTWSLELYQQFNARLWRQGQNNRVIINHLILKDSYDEEVLHTLTTKDKNQQHLIESIKKKIEKYKLI